MSSQCSKFGFSVGGYAFSGAQCFLCLVELVIVPCRERGGGESHAQESQHDACGVHINGAQTMYPVQPTMSKMESWGILSTVDKRRANTAQSSMRKELSTAATPNLPSKVTDTT